MQPLPEADVVVCCVVVGGGGAACVVVVGGGGAACVVVVGGGGGGAACVVVVGGGGGVLVWVVGTVAALALCATGFACACRWALCAGLCLAMAVEVVAGVDWVVEVVLVVAAALWVEVDDDAPHAATINVSRTAAGAMRRCLMVVSLAPWCTGLS